MVVGQRYASTQNASEKGAAFVNTPYHHGGKNPTSSLHISTKILAGVPIYDLSSPSHQIFPRWAGSGSAELSLEDSDPFQGNRDFILRYRLTGEQIASEIGRASCRERGWR